MAAPAVPAAGGVALTGALLLELLAWATLFALVYSYDNTMGALLRGLADKLRGVRWVGGTIARALQSVDDYVQGKLEDALDGIEYSVARTWDALTWVVRETGDALVAFGEDVHAAIAGLVQGEIPAQVRASTAPIAERVGRANAAQAARARAEAQARARGIDRLSRDLTAERLASERGIDALRARLGEVVMPRIRTLEGGLADVVGYTRRTLSRRLSRVEQLVLGGAIAAGALAVLTRHFPWWQCTNVRSFNRALCRTPRADLEGALALLVTTGILLNFREYVELMQRIETETAVGIQGFLSVGE